jgi:hypothetical protein
VRTLRIRALVAAAALSVGVAVPAGATPAAAAAPAGPVIALQALAFAGERVDVTEDYASVALTWTVTDRAADVAGIGGTVVLRQFVGSAPVGPARTVRYDLEAGTAPVYADSGDAASSTYKYTFVVPRYGSAPEAVWKVTRFTAKDDKGHSRTLSAPALARFGAQFAVTQLVDTAGPTADGVSLVVGQPSAVFDPGTGLTLKYDVMITDEGAGFWKGRLVVAGPGGKRIGVPFAVEDTGGWTRTCGEGQEVWDLTWLSCEIAVVLPVGSPSGTWTVARLELTDNAGNTWRSTDVTSTPVRVSRNDVLSASGFAFTEPVLDTWRTPKTTELVFTPTGAVGGLESVTLDLSWCSQLDTTPTLLPDGRASVTVQAYTFSDRCEVKGIALKDTAGNEAFYGKAHGGPELGLKITRTPDTAPPVVLSVSLPKSVWTRSELQKAWGVGITVVVDTNSPAPVTQWSATTYAADGVSSGGGMGGIQEGEDGGLGLSVHTGMLPVGEYTIGFTLTDAAGNRTSYGYPNNNNPPPGGPLVLTVIEG